MRNKEFWIALSVGALAGGIAALLYAPQSGAATRKRLRRGVEDLGDQMEDVADYLKEQAEKIGKEAEKLIAAGKDRFDDAVDSASGAVKSARSTVSRLV